MLGLIAAKRRAAELLLPNMHTPDYSGPPLHKLVFWSGTFLGIVPLELLSKVMAYVRDDARAGRAIFLMSDELGPCFVPGGRVIRRDACPYYLLEAFDEVWFDAFICTPTGKELEIARGQLSCSDKLPPLAPIRQLRQLLLSPCNDWKSRRQAARLQSGIEDPDVDQIFPLITRGEKEKFKQLHYDSVISGDVMDAQLQQRGFKSVLVYVSSVDLTRVLQQRELLL